jgi:hypothetical protein
LGAFIGYKIAPATRIRATGKFLLLVAILLIAAGVLNALIAVFLVDVWK